MKTIPRGGGKLLSYPRLLSCSDINIVFFISIIIPKLLSYLFIFLPSYLRVVYNVSILLLCNASAAHELPTP